jgi:hypothetical protein
VASNATTPLRPLPASALSHCGPGGPGGAGVADIEGSPPLRPLPARAKPPLAPPATHPGQAPAAQGRRDGIAGFSRHPSAPSSPAPRPAEVTCLQARPPARPPPRPTRAPRPQSPPESPLPPPPARHSHLCLAILRQRQRVGGDEGVQGVEDLGEGGKGARAVGGDL